MKVYNNHRIMPFVESIFLGWIHKANHMRQDDNCCIDDDVVYRSVIDNNTWKPSTYPQGWEQVN